jgi:hypothetical protein
MTYSVKVRKVGSFFWKKYPRVKADLNMMQEAGLAVRVLILEDESRVEIPALQYEFVFCKKRFDAIKKNMEKEAGQKINVD